jgi:AcrR family transcriptional regulator
VSAADETPAPPRQARGEAVDVVILDAAKELLLRDGYRGLSIEAVVERTGVAKTTIYRRYRNKADLATAAIAAYSEEAALDLPDNPRAALVAFLAGFRERMLAGGTGVLASILVERGDPGVLDLHRQRVIWPRMAQARALLEAASERGDIRADADLDLALSMIVGSFFATQIAGLDDDEGWAERAVALAWSGLEPR